VALGYRPRCRMGGSASKPEDIVRIAKEDAPFNPPLGPPNPVRSCAYNCAAQPKWQCLIVSKHVSVHARRVTRESSGLPAAGQPSGILRPPAGALRRRHCAGPRGYGGHAPPQTHTVCTPAQPLSPDLQVGAEQREAPLTSWGSAGAEAGRGAQDGGELSGAVRLRRARIWLQEVALPPHHPRLCAPCAWLGIIMFAH